MSTGKWQLLYLLPDYLLGTQQVQLSLWCPMVPPQDHAPLSSTARDGEAPTTYQARVSMLGWGVAVSRMQVTVWK